ncbi:MAG TPA: ATP-dependent zinc metalloprotease FtsH [Roseomonas sp.]|nr:ATP-dependent zinc metalloprotease FtsH [Roseomonas sp.]
MPPSRFLPAIVALFLALAPLGPVFAGPSAEASAAPEAPAGIAPPAAEAPLTASPEPPAPALRSRRHSWPGYFGRFFATQVTQQQGEILLRAGQIESVYRNIREGRHFYLTRAAAEREVLYFMPPSGEDEAAFIRQARAAGVEVLVEENSWAARLGSALQAVLLVLILAAAIALVVLFQSRGLAGLRALFRRRFQKAPAASLPPVTFADVAGQEAAKESLREIVDFLRQPARYDDLGARVPKGVLLEGDPGNGKTLLARAVAGEANVPFLFASGSEFVEMYVGLGARRVRDLFERARRHPAAIVFIDEIDVVGRARSAGARGGGEQEHDQTINQLLTELDGFERAGNIVLIAATNRADVLDPALVRPGRIDRRVFVPNPDVRSREAILDVHARKVRLGKTVSLAEVARMTPGFSGADLANVLNESALRASRIGKPAVDMDDIRSVMDRILLGEKRPSGAMEEAERRIVAYHEAGHAIAALRTKGADPVRRATIVPRGRSLGAVLQTPDRDRHLWSRGHIEGRLTVLMAGRAAEEIILEAEEVTGGASGDIQQATRIAREMIGRFGLSPEMGCLDVLGDGRAPQASGETMAKLDRLVAQEIQAAAQRAHAILEAERAALDGLAARLLAEETLTGEEVVATVEAAAAQPANDREGIAEVA